MDKHDKYEVVKQAWFEINEHLRNNKQDYIEYLKFSAKMYKQPYSDAVLVFQQNRNATKIAEYKKWGRLGRYVRRGSHGVAVFGKNHTCRYLYDVTQTGGKELPEMWTLTDRNTPELLNTLNNRYNINAGSVKECIEAMTANSINSAPIAESVQNAISQMGLDTKQAEVYRHSLNSVVRFVVSQRCNLYGKIDLNTDVDVSALDLIKNARDMILFSRAVQHAAKDTLFEIEKEVIAIDHKNEALDNAKTAKQESTSDRVDDILKDLIRLKFSQDQILALKQAVVAAAQNGEHNIRHWVSVRYSPDELRHISSLLSDYYAQSVIEQTLDPKGILNDYYTYVNELNGRLKLSDMFSHHEYSDEQKAMLQQGFSEGISITVLNEVDERLTVDEIKTFFEMFHQAVDGQIDPHDVQIYLDTAVIEHSKQNVQAVEVQDNSADTISADVTQQDKKIEPSRIIGLAENQLRPAVPNSSTSSITDSSGVVKSEKTFAEQVDEALSGKLPFYTSLKVCDTPQILIDVGCEQLPMLYTQKHLKNAILPPDERNHRHGLEIEQIKRLPELLSYPVMIIDSPNRKDSIIVVTSEVDKSDNPIIASIKPNGKGRYEVENVSSNFITSVYGRNNFPEFFRRIVQSDNLLFCDKQKSQAMFERWGEQYSELTNNLDSNIIIHQSRNIVKSKKQENSADISSNDVKTSAALSEPTITCEWSESNYFEDGKTYSVAEFDTLMEQADSEMVAGAKAAIEKYGSAKAWYEADADIQTADMLKLPVPKLETGKPIVVTSKPDERQKAYMKELATRSETIHSGTVDPRQDNMLKITHEARLLGLDTRCIFKDAQPAPDSKVMKLIDNLEKNYKNTMTEKGVQIVFCDIAINEDETHFSVYKAIKQALMERGIPEKEICFAGDAKTDKARDEMFKSLRKGEKRFIIASTSKLGTGANIQDRICAIHHLDIPWKPSDLTQQDGRGIRQGNRFSQVGIYHYLTEETFDAYMMGIITNKAKFINQILTSKSPARVSEDVDEMVLTYSEMQAIASGNPMIKEKIQLDNDVAMLKTLEAEHKKSIYKMQELAEKTLPKQITHYSELLAKSKSDMSKYQEQQALNKEFEMTIGGVRYDKRENAGEQIAVAMAKCTATGEPIELGTYRGFKVTIERNPSANTFFELDTPCIAVLHGELTYSCDVATDNGVGNVRRIENLAGIQINQKLCSLEEQLEKANKDLSEAQQNMLKPFEHGQELAEKTKRLEYVNAQLSGNSQNKNHTPESAIEFRFHNNKYQALIGTNEKSEWCDVVSKGGKLIASSDTKIYNLSEKESDQFRSYVFNGGKTDTSKNNSLLEKLKPKALKL